MDPKDILNIAHLEDPKGTNDKTALGTFYWRGLYKEFIYPSEQVGEPFDLWYDKTFYGRVDLKGIPMYPSEKFLKQIPAKNTVFAVNFVADAFIGFQKFMETAVRRGDVVAEGSLYGGIEPFRGWVSIHKDLSLIHI